jgi:poly-gamma-glutamate capsule biosynthesis protein CapA/YwtB (metallophosphatase superfamily)
MSLKMMLTGDINLMNVTDPVVPFRHVTTEFNAADFVFSNLECCLYQPPRGESVDGENKSEGFFAAPGPSGEALKKAGVKGVGIANNVNYGESAINASVARLDELGIQHTGAGANREKARAPAILECNGVRVGFLQRTSVYWPTNHEATKNATGVAITRAHTAYQLPLHKLRPEMSPCNRPGLPPIILTWADPPYMQMLKDEITALRAKTDFVVVSCHWGLHRDVLDYMPEIAHGAIDAGADVVMGHGPHFSLPVEAYKGKPIFYGLGSFSFHTGHGGIKHGNWVGMLARIGLEDKKVKSATFQFVRHNEANETVLCSLANERETLEDITKRGAAFKTRLTPQGDQVAIELAG